MLASAPEADPSLPALKYTTFSVQYGARNGYGLGITKLIYILLSYSYGCHGDMLFTPQMQAVITFATHTPFTVDHGDKR